jgi:hypothetical protein
MSAYGTKRTSQLRLTMSAFGGKPDVVSTLQNFRESKRVEARGFIATRPLRPA